MKSFKKILLITAIMAMMFALVAVNASAADVKINDVDLLNDTTVDLDEGTAYYDSANKILTLTNAKITATSCDAIKTYSNRGEFTIKTVGKCEIIVSDSYGIFSSTGTPLKIEGATGSKLVIKSTKESIFTQDNLTIIKSDITCTSTSSSAIHSSRDIKIENSKIYLTGTNGYGLDAFSNNGNIEGNISIKDCEGTITSEASAIWAMNGSVSFEGKDVLELNSLNGHYCVFGSKGVTIDLLDGSKIHAKSMKNAISTATGCVLTIKSGNILLPTDGQISSDKIAIQSVGASEYANEVTIGFETKDDTNEDNAKEDSTKEYSVKEVEQTTTWTIGGKDGAVLTSTADLDKLVSVSVDGTVIDASNYDTASGSTIITFKPAYLKTLSAGKHTVVINSTDGSATGYLVIKEDQKIAQTGDNNAIGAFAALTVFSVAGFATLKKKEN